MEADRELEWRCTLNGLRPPSHEKRAVALWAYRLDAPFTMEELCKNLADGNAGVSRPTVFRTVALMKQVGMLSRNGVHYSRM